MLRASEKCGGLRVELTRVENGRRMYERIAAIFALVSMALVPPVGASSQCADFPAASVALIVSDAAQPSLAEREDKDCISHSRTDRSPAICLRFGWPHARLAEEGGFRVEQISSSADKPIPIGITLPKDIVLTDAQRIGPVFLMFRGLPPEITLSAGFRLRDAWAVSLRDVPNLSMTAPPGYRGSYMLSVTLHKGKNDTPDTQILSVRLGPAAARAGPPQQPPTAELPSVILTTTDPAASTTLIAGSAGRLGDGEETTLLANASEMLGSGDIDAARLVYSELAAHGSGRAAFLMAQTYDPQILAERFVVGLQPDLEQAKQWYGRAAGLGDRDAKERLRVLLPDG